jgi:hypothetical protein
MEFIVYKSTLNHTLHQTPKAPNTFGFFRFENVYALLCDVYEPMSKHYIQS